MKSFGRLDLCMLFQSNEYSLAGTHYKIKKEGNIKKIQWNWVEFHEQVGDTNLHIYKKLSTFSISASVNQ